MLTGALGWAVAFMPVSPSSALRIPDAGPEPHILHHTFASHYMMGGGDILALQRILGHSSMTMTMTMTMRYAHLSPEHLESAMRLSPLAQLGQSAICYQ